MLAVMPHEPYHLPIWYDLLATAAFAATGALVAIRKHYDIVGVIALALAVGAGGGVIRDGVFLQQTPALVTDWRYIAVIVASSLLVLMLGRNMERRRAYITIAFLDALGLAGYTIVGTQKCNVAGLVVAGAILVGIINAVGGGVLRDVLSGEKPEIFRPSHLYALVSLCGAVAFVLLSDRAGLSTQTAANIAIIGMVLARTASIAFDIRTKPAKDLLPPGLTSKKP